MVEMVNKPRYEGRSPYKPADIWLSPDSARVNEHGRIGRTYRRSGSSPLRNQPIPVARVIAPMIINFDTPPPEIKPEDLKGRLAYEACSTGPVTLKDFDKDSVFIKVFEPQDQ